MLMADHNNMSGRPADVGANRTIEWVAQDDSIAPTQAKAGMSEVLNIRHIFDPLLVIGIGFGSF
jgi:hypothetical protein